MVQLAFDIHRRLSFKVYRIKLLRQLFQKCGGAREPNFHLILLLSFGKITLEVTLGYAILPWLSASYVTTSHARLS